MKSKAKRSPEMLPEAAVTVTEPTLTLVARPYVPAASLIVAIVPSEVLQYALEVRSAYCRLRSYQSQ